MQVAAAQRQNGAARRQTTSLKGLTDSEIDDLELQPGHPAYRHRMAARDDFKAIYEYGISLGLRELSIAAAGTGMSVADACAFLDGHKSDGRFAHLRN
ncbi:MAG: hypothetical protein WDN04_15695 [Rhodospirillales bacterium]